MMSPERNGTASPKLCGLGIAFKPDKKGNLYVKRLIILCMEYFTLSCVAYRAFD